jgi:uncharacterized membrane protein YcfT
MPPFATPGAAPSTDETPEAGRLAWADAAKGVCIVLVVLHHLVTKQYDLLVPDGTLVEAFWQWLTDALKPVRMPLFFAVSGMFAARAIHRQWRDVASRRIGTPYYLYAVWLTIHAFVFAILTELPMNRSRSVSEWAGDLVLASTGLWYLYALAAYFVLAKVLLRVDARAVLALAAVASASASLLPIEAANRESLLQYFVFFLAGVHLPELLRDIAVQSRSRVTGTLVVASALLAVAVWAVGLPRSAASFAIAVVAVPLAIRLVAASCSRPWFETTGARLGRNTLPIYVLHVPVLSVMHEVVVRVDAIGDLADAPSGLIVLAVYPVLGTALVTATCLLLHAVLVRLGLGALFRRGPISLTTSVPAAPARSSWTSATRDPTMPSATYPGREGGWAMSAPAYDLKRRLVYYSDGNSGFYAVRLAKRVVPERYWR